MLGLSNEETKRLIQLQREYNIRKSRVINFLDESYKFGDVKEPKQLTMQEIKEFNEIKNTES